MGVKDLWGVLSPVCGHRPLSELHGQVIAVDLSIWVVETQGMKQLQGVVSKPHLRNIFFRISHLTQLGVKLVFAVEGDPPPLKWDTICKRLQAQNRGPARGGKRAGGGSRKMTRPHFKALLRECCEMLDYMGVPYVQSAGEAEAMCALLNQKGLVDAVITNDGDAFLYGAKLVYKSFTMNTKDPHVESYNMQDIEQKLHLDRERLVGLGLLLGCDFVPQGVPGVGRETATKLLAELHEGCSILRRFRQWCRPNIDITNKTEMTVRRKALLTPGFPDQRVIDEFMVSKDQLPSVDIKYKRPKMFHLQKFQVDKLEWEEDYALEKVLPLVTWFDLTMIKEKGLVNVKKYLKPHSIVKTRVKQGVPCVEINWHKVDGDSESKGDYYTTIEEEALFKACFPDMLEQYHAKKAAAKTSKKTGGQKRSKKKEVSCETQENNDIDLTSRMVDSLHISDPGVSVDVCSAPSVLPTSKSKSNDVLTTDEVSHSSRSSSNEHLMAGDSIQPNKSPQRANSRVLQDILNISSSPGGVSFFVPTGECHGKVKPKSQRRQRSGEIGKSKSVSCFQTRTSPAVKRVPQRLCMSHNTPEVKSRSQSHTEVNERSNCSSLFPDVFNDSDPLPDIVELKQKCRTASQQGRKKNSRKKGQDLLREMRQKQLERARIASGQDRLFSSQPVLSSNSNMGGKDEDLQFLPLSQRLHSKSSNDSSDIPDFLKGSPINLDVTPVRENSVRKQMHLDNNGTTQSGNNVLKSLVSTPKVTDNSPMHNDQTLTLDSSPLILQPSPIRAQTHSDITQTTQVPNIGHHPAHNTLSHVSVLQRSQLGNFCIETSLLSNMSSLSVTSGDHNVSTISNRSEAVLETVHESTTSADTVVVPQLGTSTRSTCDSDNLPSTEHNLSSDNNPHNGAESSKDKRLCDKTLLDRLREIVDESLELEPSPQSENVTVSQIQEDSCLLNNTQDHQEHNVSTDIEEDYFFTMSQIPLAERMKNMGLVSKEEVFNTKASSAGLKHKESQKSGSVNVKTTLMCDKENMEFDSVILVD